MSGRVVKLSGRQKRKARVKRRLGVGGGGRARLSVFRSNKHIYAQVVVDVDGKTVASASTLSKEIKGSSASLSKLDVAKKVGELVGKVAKENGIVKVVFDRSGYLYHGRVKALADGAREAGLEF